MTEIIQTWICKEHGSEWTIGDPCYECNQPKQKALDVQIGGGHYKDMAIQPMEYSMKNGLDACQHTAIKYISRFRNKGGIQDLEKAKHCIDMLIQFEQEKTNVKA